MMHKNIRDDERRGSSWPDCVVVVLVVASNFQFNVKVDWQWHDKCLTACIILASRDSCGFFLSLSNLVASSLAAAVVSQYSLMISAT